MRPETRAAFVPMNAPIEGVLSFMYLDVKGLVTTGMGNLIDTPDEALSLPWRNADGSLATRMQIAGEWSYVKSRQDMKLKGGGAFGTITRLRLDAAGVDSAVARTLDRMDHALEARFPFYDLWPWQAQLATLSMSWACGPAFRFPKLEAALRAEDFLEASKHCTIQEAGNPGVIPRNVKNRELYVAATPASKAFDLSTVEGLQGALSRLGHDPGPADGKLGPKTKAAIVSFQSAKGLTPDGIAGPKTRSALASALFNHP